MPYAELADPDDGHIHVQTMWNEKTLIKQIPGARYEGKLKVWRTRRTWAAYVQLHGVFKDTLQVGPLLNAWAWHEKTTRVDPAMRLRTAITTDKVFHPMLYGFQNADVEWMIVAGSGILGNEAGTGKTPPLLVLSTYLMFLGGYTPSLIIPPNSVKYHWASHIRTWAPMITPYVVDGSAKNRAAIIEDARQDPNAAVIVNIEALRLLSRLAPYGSIKLARCRECDPQYGDDIKPSRCHIHPKPLNGFGFRSIIADEIHRAKDPKSQQTRALWALAHEPDVEHRWGATGTLIEHDPLEAWSSFHIVAPDEYPVRSTFGDRYALMSWNVYGGIEVVGLRPDTKAELFAFMDPRYRRMIKDVVLPQLPPKVYPPTRLVDQTAAQKRMAKELTESMTTVDESGELAIVPSDPAVRVRKSQLAVASLAVTSKPDPDDPKTWTYALREPSPVLDDLEAVLDEFAGQQVLVVADYKQLIDLAAARLGKRGTSYGLITGDVTPVDRERNRQLFQDGKLRAMLFTAQAGGVGLNMSAASVVIFIQRPRSMINYTQAVDRAHRPGAEVHESIIVVHIAARGTVEEDKANAIAEKLERLEEINRDREQRRAAGLDMTALDNEINTIMHTPLVPDYVEEAP